MGDWGLKGGGSSITGMYLKNYWKGDLLLRVGRCPVLERMFETALKK